MSASIKRVKKTSGLSCVMLPCDACGAPLKLDSFRLQYKHHFCSHACEAKWRRKQPRKTPTRFSLRRLKELLSYNPRTGHFTWLVDRPPGISAGTRAGTLRKNDKRRQMCIDQELYFAAPLAVFYVTGRWPKTVVDHINRDASDDRWSNLRFATNSQNGANSRANTNKKYTPLRGVTFDKERRRYIARIKVNYRQIHLGYFDTPETAHAAYVAAAKKHFGEFARAR